MHLGHHVFPTGLGELGGSACPKCWIEPKWVRDGEKRGERAVFGATYSIRAFPWTRARVPIERGLHPFSSDSALAVEVKRAGSNISATVN